MNNMTVSPTSIKMDEALKGRIHKLAEARHRSAHSMMLEAIQLYVEREEKLEQFRDEMEQVWEDYQEDGLHASGQEVLAWMESWFTEDEKPIPKCQH